MSTIFRNHADGTTDEMVSDEVDAKSSATADPAGKRPRTTDRDDPEATTLMDAAEVTAAGGAEEDTADQQPVTDSKRKGWKYLYRDEVPEDETRPLPSARKSDPDQAKQDPDAERLAERDRRRAERDKALGNRRRQPEQLTDQRPTPAPVVVATRTTDKWYASLGLFLFRIILAAVMGLHGLAHLIQYSDTVQMLNTTAITDYLPAEPVAYVLAGAEIAIAITLIFGVFTRVAGLGLAAIAIMSLVFIHWLGNPFHGYALTGEFELVLAGCGLLLLCLGGGAWGVDGAMRRRRAASK
ncbi:DoxX family protein [Granulicoccus phenolivorans]|uniref:DoxX family protein n=1 Tax=Granulicoccus phenolivorans TaxID=266854 RepID=UPI00041CF902|nr:DoxX family protein [Granulicoccus phenolivorans]